jgi:hypothetical protein
MGINREEDKEKLVTQPHNSERTIAWSEEGGGLVYRLWDVYVLFEVLQYGGEASHAGTFHERQIDEILDLAYSWT